MHFVPGPAVHCDDKNFMIGVLAGATLAMSFFFGGCVGCKNVWKNFNNILLNAGALLPQRVFLSKVKFGAGHARDIIRL